MQTNITNIRNWKEDETHINDLYHWISKIGVKTSYSNEEEIYPNLIAHDTLQGNNINQFDFQFIESIIVRTDYFIEKAIQSIKDDVMKNPDKFSVTSKRLKELSGISIKEFPISFPDLIFYPDNTWIIHFADADFPNVEYGLGVSIDFKGEDVVGLEILSYDDEIEIDL